MPLSSKKKISEGKHYYHNVDYLTWPVQASNGEGNARENDLCAFRLHLSLVLRAFRFLLSLHYECLPSSLYITVEDLKLWMVSLKITGGTGVLQTAFAMLTFAH